MAAHYCLAESAESTESATVLRSLASQLTKRFPNLVLPKLSTLTLLADYDNALEQYFTLPLASLPRPAKPLFILVDNVLPHIYDLVLAVSGSLTVIRHVSKRLIMGSALASHRRPVLFSPLTCLMKEGSLFRFAQLDVIELAVLRLFVCLDCQFVG